jgi:hypothetical protein
MTAAAYPDERSEIRTERSATSDLGLRFIRHTIVRRFIGTTIAGRRRSAHRRQRNASGTERRGRLCSHASDFFRQSSA